MLLLKRLILFLSAAILLLSGYILFFSDMPFPSPAIKNTILAVFPGRNEAVAAINTETAVKSRDYKLPELQDDREPGKQPVSSPSPAPASTTPGKSGSSTTPNIAGSTSASGQSGQPSTTAPGTPSGQKSSDTPSSEAVSPSPSPIPSQVPNSKRLVVIDAGHGGNDNGTKDNGVAEKDVTLDIALKLNTLLTNSKIDTYMIRKTDIYMDHKERIQKANSLGAALYMSIHCDWFGDTSLHGTQTLYYPSKTLAIGGLNEIDYARTIQVELIKGLGTNDRGINERPNLAVLRQATMPTVLVELGFLSNKGDAQRLSSEEFRQKAANALFEGIKKSLNKIDNK